MGFAVWRIWLKEHTSLTACKVYRVHVVSRVQRLLVCFGVCVVGFGVRALGLMVISRDLGLWSSQSAPVSQVINTMITYTNTQPILWIAALCDYLGVCTTPAPKELTLNRPTGILNPKSKTKTLNPA